MATAKEMMLTFLAAYDEKKIDLKSLVYNVMDQVPAASDNNFDNTGVVMVGQEDNKFYADIIHEEDEVLRRIEITQEEYNYCVQEEGCEEF